MKILAVISVIASLRGSVGFITGEVTSLAIGDEQVQGVGLSKSGGEHEKPFLWRFTNIPYDDISHEKTDGSTALSSPTERLHLDLYTSEKTRDHLVPIVISFGGVDIAESCQYISEKVYDGTVLINVPLTKPSPEEHDVDDVSSNARMYEKALENMRRIQSATIWTYQNARRFGGDKARITLAGFGKDASLAVSLASAKTTNDQLFQRAIIEFGDHSAFGIDELLQVLKSDGTDGEITPPRKNLLIGYDSSTTDLQHVTSLVDFVEAFANTGSRVTLFDRSHDHVRDSSTQTALFKLAVQFTNEKSIDDRSVFPQLKLAKWRRGLEVLELDGEKWTTVTKNNLFEYEHRATNNEIDPFPVVSTSLGELRGRHLQRGEYEADAFFHIPYASETGRFEYSEMVEPWGSLLDARYPVRYKDCPQNVIVNFGHEDCLNLVVFVPQTFNETLSGDPLPVMVFMHGGSYAVGTAAGIGIPQPFDMLIYDGTVMADFAKVVVVSVNYRLAALGFLNDGDVDNGVLDGNYGARDMVLALQWVQKHIGEFGGDPELVTLFGESAGATGTGLLGLSPMTKGLIKRHIQESGSPLSFFAVDFNPSQRSTEVFTELGCRSENFTATKECLMRRDEFDFIGLYSPHPYVPWRPTIDGVFLTEDPAITATKPTELDLIVGHNYDELYIIAASIIPRLLTDLPLTPDDLEKLRQAMDIVLLEHPDRQQYISEVVFHSCLTWEMDSTTEAMKIALVRSSSDYVFAAPSIRQALIRSRNMNGSTYMYSFEIKSKLRIVADWSTNSHAFELPYVFGQGLRRTENGPVYNATQDKLSLQMISYWTNFAKTGNPNLPMTEEIEGNIWEAYNESTKRYMALNFKMTPDNLRSDYRSYEIQLWNELVPLLLQQDRDACSGKKQKLKTSKKIERSGKVQKRKMKHNRFLPTISFGTKTTKTVRDTCDLTEDLVRNTTAGCVRGVLSDHLGTTIETYLGIPYAEPPTGELRFSPTKRVESWSDGVLDADGFMPDCPRNATLEGQDEDCLYLNIYRPNSEDSLPVMVWIHSDPHEGSGGAQYDGKRVAAFGNVVLITFNYRLGVFGFLGAGGDTDAAGNQALLDQNAALLWVKDNIENFGGMSSKITIFGDGESSKFAGYHTVTTVNSGRSLFSNVIHQSGVGQFDDAVPMDNIESANNLATNLGCVFNTTEDMLSCIKNKTTEEIMQNASLFDAQVVVDGNFFRDQPSALFEESLQRLHYLIGFTSGEGSSEYESVIGAVNDRTSFSQYIEDAVVLDAEFANPERVKAVVEYEYMDFATESENLAQKFQIAAMNMHGDKDVVAPSMVLANRTSAIARFRTRTYVCKLTSPADDQYPEWVGAPSGSLEKLFWRHFAAADDTPEAALSDRIVKYWTTFARNGRPFGMDSDDSWKRYKTDSGEYGELEMQSNFSLVRNYPRPKYATLWNNLIPRLDVEFPCDFPPPPEVAEIETTDGVRVRGYSETSSDGRNYDVFRGLPFAKPPTGQARFSESEFDGDIPQPPSGSATLLATIKKPRCLQTANGARGGFASEDCLYLDIWRPNGVELDSVPVMFWICNGGYSVGGPHSQLGDDASCDVDGQLMALDGEFIFVKVQYRIGVMGFLSSGDSTLAGNAGLSDLKNALRWVYKNIGDFGGDKDRVTLAGNGIGGTLAMLLGGVSSNIPGGTVQNVIAQTGSLTSPWAFTIDPEVDLFELAIRTGCNAPLQTNVISCLRGLDALQVITSAGSLNSNFPFGIYADDANLESLTKESFLDLTVDGHTLRSVGESLSSMPTLVGLNGGAGYHFTLQAYPEIRLLYGRRPITSDLVRTVISDDVYLDNLGLSWEEQTGVLEGFYVPWGQTDSRNEIRRSAVQYHTDEGFLIPIYDEIGMRLSQSETAPVYFYAYEEATDASRARWQTAGADLGEEIPVLFKEGLGDQKAALGVAMRHYWTNFVNTGNPGSGTETERWRRYTAGDKRTMVFDTSGVRLVSGYRDQALKIWQEVFAPPQISEETTLPCPTVTCATSTNPPTCPTVVCPTCSSDNNKETCAPDPIMGGGIGLELTPSEADVAIEALFGISLSFACIGVLAIGVYFMKRRSRKKPSKGSTDLVISNEDNRGGTPPPDYQEFSAL